MEVVDSIQKLKELPSDSHWFCPRSGADDQGQYFHEDLQDQRSESDPSKLKEREAKLEAAKERKQLVFGALQIFAFDGDDAAPFQQWIEDRLREQMVKCDICVREYHRGRRDLKSSLEELHDEVEVEKFLERLDDINLNRIKTGLDHANKTLLALPPDKRGVGLLGTTGLYAIFEALNCIPALTNEDFLVKHFDEPFRQVQTNKRLRIALYLPAMTYFLFQKQHDRRTWALTSWSKSRRNITPLEFECTVFEPLQRAMNRVQLSMLEKDFLPTFWEGVKHISDRLDSGPDEYSLHASTKDVCKLALDHLQVDSDAFRFLLAAIDRILRVSPTVFWDAISSSSALVWIEQFKNSPALFRLLLSARDESKAALLADLLRWTSPFVSSLKPIQQASACRGIVDVLFVDLQREKYSPLVRTHCYSAGLQALSATLKDLTTDKIPSSARVALADVLEVVGSHASTLARFATRPSLLAEPAAAVIRQALALDCQCLLSDRDVISSGQALQQGSCALHTDLWKEMVSYVKPENAALTNSILSGVKNLVGLERFVAKHDTQSTPRERLNQTLDAMNGYVRDVLERAAEFDAHDVSKLFDSAENAQSSLAQIFSSDAGVRSAAVELLKAATGQTVRREALGDILASNALANVLNACSVSLRRMAYMQTYAPAPWILVLCRDVLDVLCNSSTGIMRGSEMHTDSIKAAETLWQSMWLELQTIFGSTETWSNMGHEKSQMMKFCGDVMELAGNLFDQFPIFASAIELNTGSNKKLQGAGKRLTEDPRSTLPVMMKFLRLRDEFLLRKSTSLVCDVLTRAKQFDIAVDEAALFSLEEMIVGKTKTALTTNQKAELHQALETHLGKPFIVEPETSTSNTKTQTQTTLKTGVIDLEKWTAKAGSVVSTPNLEAYKARQLATRPSVRQPQSTLQKPSEAKPVDPAEFGRKRQEEIAAKKRRDAEAVAKARAHIRPGGVNALTPGHGSAISGMGVSAKDHSVPKGEGMMVSSDESEGEESETEMDRELFGTTTSKKFKKSAEDIRIINEDKARRRMMAQQQQGPVKKQRLVRSLKDMRARLAPNLAPLHNILLSWDFNHNGPFPPNASIKDYAAVHDTFRTPVDYQNTFQPLLALEAWNGFMKAKEENTTRPFEIKVINRSTVDAFLEVATTIDPFDGKESGVSEGDLILLAKGTISSGNTSPSHSLARVQRMKRKKTHIEVLLRILPGGLLVQSLKPNTSVSGLKIMSLIPLEREFGALNGLPYYDLCEEITKAKISPLIKYNDDRLQVFIRNYSLNKAQAKAIRSALENDAFTLIQGPPGSGKTKTIVAIVGALLTNVLRQPKASNAPPRSEFIANRPPSKKLLVCAPSNAAVDELVMRFKEGIRIMSGEQRKIGIVRLGRGDSINPKVQDVTLEELINKRLNISKENAAREETQKLMREHQQISEKLRAARQELDKEENPENRQKVDDLKKSKHVLSQRIDRAKDEEGMQTRQADLNRRRVQQDIIEEAHVICATLSGSGHDMFQSLNVEFETVVIDEAAQCVELSAIIPLKYGCAKCILVGDPQQLPPTVFSREAAKFKYEQSLFVRMQSNHPKDVHLLDTQYRMHPAISVFPSQTFYDGRLLDGPNMARTRTRPWHAADLLGPFQFFDVAGQHQSASRGHSLVNHAEVRVAMQLYERLTTDFKEDYRGKVGVITPYKTQLSELRRQFQDNFGATVADGIEFNTTDAFQGRESEIIIFSCVRASPSGGIGFLQDIRRMNVGLTRAKASLWVLGNSQSLARGEYWSKLVAHAKHAGSFFQGNIEAVLGRPLAQTRRVELPADTPADAPAALPGSPSGNSSDAMSVDGAAASSPSSTHSLKRARSPAVPAKRDRPSSSSSASASASASAASSDEQSASDMDMEMRDAAPPDKKPRPADGDGDGDSDGAGAPARAPAPAPRVKAIIRRKRAPNVYATDPSRKRRPGF